jgi:GDSL-like Lipase/Acylhydrolase family
MASHIVLLGDSIFDNCAYTGGAPDVVGHLRELLPAAWRATLCAVDGSTAADLSEQFVDVPSDGSHLVISTGGNDALLNSDLLGTSVSSTAEALSLFGDRIWRFEQAYRAAIDGALAMRRDTTVCTIYNGNLEAREAALARVALMMFNDVILRVAFERGLRVIDLRLVCTEAADYANPIEPSGRGGRKIAQAISRSLGAADEQIHPATVYAC